MLENEIIEVNMVLHPQTQNLNIIENKINKKQAIISVKEYLHNPEIIKSLKLPEIKQHLKYYKTTLTIPAYYKTFEKKRSKTGDKIVS